MRTALAVAGALLLAGCSAGDGGSVDSTETVCDEFAAHAKKDLPADDRPGVVDSIGEVIGNADQGIQNAYAGLENTATGADSAYRLAADAFAQSCFDAGWDG